MQCKFHHVALSVKNFDKVVAFYKEILDLKEKISWDMDGTPATMLEMADGGIIEVFGNGSDAKEQDSKWGHLAVVVDDVPGAYKKALELGAKSHIEPAFADIAGGGNSMKVEIAFVIGLGGEILEFFKVV